MLQNLFPLISDSVLNQNQIAFMRSHRVEMEAKRQLSPEILDLIYEQEWLKVMEPESCSGRAWSLPRVVQLFEKLAYADGNVGWCVNLGAGANLFSGYFPEKTAKEIFTPKETWCAGSGALSGTARRVEDGFVTNGYWKYASGSVHATHFTANCVLLDESGMPETENGELVFRSFIFPKEVITVHDTWQVTGLKATSSNDFEVKDVFVPQEKTFSLTQPSGFATSPIFHFPFATMAVVNMASMATGIAIHFMECFESLMANKKPMHNKAKLGELKVVSENYLKSKERFLTKRDEMYVALEQAWLPYQNGQQASSKNLVTLTGKTIQTVKAAREMVFHLFPFCGMNILYTTSELNQVWRDFSVAGQHYLLSGLYSN